METYSYYNSNALEGTFIKEWIGATQAMKQLGIDKASIGRVCKGKNESAGNFKWSYKNAD